jgi:hypothetical protein
MMTTAKTKINKNKRKSQHLAASATRSEGFGLLVEFESLNITARKSAAAFDSDFVVEVGGCIIVGGTEGFLILNRPSNVCCNCRITDLGCL